MIRIPFFGLYEPHFLPVDVSSALADPAKHPYISHISILEITDKAAKFRLPMAGFLVENIVERIHQFGAIICRSI